MGIIETLRESIKEIIRFMSSSNTAETKFRADLTSNSLVIIIIMYFYSSTSLI
jgi:hypothetical protein